MLQQRAARTRFLWTMTALPNGDVTEASKRGWQVGRGEVAATSSSSGSALTCAVLAWGADCLRRERLSRERVVVHSLLASLDSPTALGAVTAEGWWPQTVDHGQAV